MSHKPVLVHASKKKCSIPLCAMSDLYFATHELCIIFFVKLCLYRSTLHSSSKYNKENSLQTKCKKNKISVCSSYSVTHEKKEQLDP